MYLHGMILS